MLAYLNSPTAALLQHLHNQTMGKHPGPVLRIGGNSADKSCFVEDELPLPRGCDYRITSEQLRAYASFAAQFPELNITYVLDVNFGVSETPEIAVAHIQAIGREQLWPLVRAVEIGNEHDHYARRSPQDQWAKGHRDMNFHYRAYASQLADYIGAMHANGLPHHRVQGGTWACSPSHAVTERSTVTCGGGFAGNISEYIKSFAGDLTSFSFHRYGASHCGNKELHATDLLLDRASRGHAAVVAPLVAAAGELEFVIGEGNSVACGGVAGVSDTFASALWVLDFLCEMSKAGVRRVNLHSGPSVLYTPIGFGRDGELQVRPLYYGLRLYAELTANYSVWLASHETSAARWDASLSESDPRCDRGIASPSSATCCARSCETCGGVGCEDRAGGESACCHHAITSSGRMCTHSEAPCVIDSGFQQSPIVQHATLDVHGTVRVLVIARAANAREPRSTSVCLPSAMEAADVRKAHLVVLKAPSLTSTHNDRITLAGQTWSQSTDGLPTGLRQTIVVTGHLNISSDQPAGTRVECFAFKVAPASAAMLVIPSV